MNDLMNISTGPREFDDYAAYCQARPTLDVMFEIEGETA